MTVLVDVAQAPGLGNKSSWTKPSEDLGLGQEPGKLIEHPSVWKASDWEGRTEQIHNFSEADIQELEAALKHAQATGKDVKDWAKEDFPLPNLGPVLIHARDEVVFGRGFHFFRGLPVQKWSRQESVSIYFGIGLHIGKAKTHSHKGELVHHVKDVITGVEHVHKDRPWLGDPNNPNTRYYATNTYHPHHTESITDIVSLLCLHPAKSGGEFRFASTPFLHNEVLKARPDLLEALTKDWAWDAMGNSLFNADREGAKRYYELPVLTYHKGFLNWIWNPRGFFTAHRFEEVPRPTQAQLDAVDLIKSLADEHGITVSWQPGEIALLNAHVHMHWRNAFENDEDPSKHRHLLRLYLSPPEERPLPESHRHFFGGNLEVGNRGGYNSDPALAHVPFYAEDGK